jgi:stress-induced morphogen
MDSAEIVAMIKVSLPDAEISIIDTAGDSNHYAAKIVSASFNGLSRVKRHQIVYAALKGKMGGELHALSLETISPDEVARS